MRKKNQHTADRYPMQEKYKQTTQPATDDEGWTRGQLCKADNNLEKYFIT